eukprot:CAMPEP_0119491838 /NCGR_PEP_ID=MMETSP1344-20130328/16587_1 /TAXON_ID=236787 /ORGANISM="Florenciella parvula, Strain CCMP2471" /LENGTH=60 /DNA_ID=CAMNT_0007527127 /DNA_START=431 /DNA_END=609 /DNA_ORIENTATION=-
MDRFQLLGFQDAAFLLKTLVRFCRLATRFELLENLLCISSADLVRSGMVRLESAGAASSS